MKMMPSKRLTLFIILLIHLLNDGISWKIKLSKRDLATIALLITPPPLLIETSFYLNPLLYQSTVVVNADSTGKFSTKLPARKRYLPRIIQGVNEFREMSKSPKSPSADLFFKGKGDEKAGYDSFIRASSLYGASLRKGEVPDAISRQADDLVQIMKKKLDIVAKTRSVLDFEKTKMSINDFLLFCKIEETL